jgi:hypothetical protein
MVLNCAKPNETPHPGLDTEGARSLDDRAPVPASTVNLNRCRIVCNSNLSGSPRNHYFRE